MTRKNAMKAMVAAAAALLMGKKAKADVITRQLAGVVPVRAADGSFPLAQLIPGTARIYCNGLRTAENKDYTIDAVGTVHPMPNSALVNPDAFVLVDYVQLGGFLPILG